MKPFLNKRLQGLSIIEVLIVVVILALLILLAITTVLKNLLKGNDARRKSDMSKIKIYIEEYEKDHNCYPTASSMALCGSDEAIAIHPYMSNVPCDPITHDAYVYEPDPDTTSCPSWFRLYTSLQNENDPKIFDHIGPGNAYNYYVSSDNAPNPERCASSPAWGCYGSQCRKICPEDCVNKFSSLSSCLAACPGVGSECSP